MSDWASIAVIAVGLITPLVKKASEKTAEKVGEAVFNLVKTKFEGDEEAETTLKNFENNPKRHEAALTDIIKEKAETDPDFGTALNKLVAAADKAGQVTISQQAIGRGIAQAAGTGSSATVSLGKSDE